MKRFLLPLLALAPLAASAQPKPTIQVSVDPSAKALFDIAAAQYGAASGLRFDLTSTEYKARTRSRVFFQKPGLLRVQTLEANGGERFSTLLSVGEDRYIVSGKSYERFVQPANTIGFWQEPLPGGIGFMLPPMLQGKSPLDKLQKEAPPSLHSKVVVSLASATIIDGETLSGARLSISTTQPLTSTSVIYVWFGPDGLLRRLSLNRVYLGVRFQATEVLSNQQLNPKFVPNTFKFNPAGLTPADGR